MLERRVRPPRFLGALYYDLHVTGKEMGVFAFAKLFKQRAVTHPKQRAATL